MSGEQEFTGKSVDAAIAEAERTLGKSRDQLEIQVVSQGSRGVFGLGGEPARVLARDPSVAVEPPSPVAAMPEEEPKTPVLETVETYEEIDVEKSESEANGSDPAIEAESGAHARGSRPRRERLPRPPRARRSRDEDEGEDERERPDIDTEEVSRAAHEILETLLGKMGFEVEVSIREGDDPITLDVAGDNLGILIGRRGDSLAALQFMVNVILSKQFRTWPRVVVDVQGYRDRREQSLSALGTRVADRVRRNRRPFTLEAMPANDRRIIHLTLRERNDVETYSIGEGQSRRVVIAPKR